MTRSNRLGSPVPRWVVAWLPTIVAIIAGCGGGPQTTGPTTNPVTLPPTFGPRDSVFTDAQLLAAAYSTYSVPPGFYRDPGTVSVYYVNSASILDPHHRPAFPWTELSTEDVQQARAWAESSVVYSNQVAAVAPAPPIVTSRYFEFLDAPGAGVTHVRMRVHRSSYLSGLLASGPGPNGVLATFNERPVRTENVGPLAGYLLTQSALRGSNRKVLSSFSSNSPSEVGQTLYTAQLVRGGYEFDIPDQIVLLRWEYRVDKATGVIRSWYTSVRGIFGRPY